MIDFSNIKLPQDMTTKSNADLAREIARDILDTFRAWNEDQITERITAALDAKDAQAPRVPTVEEFARAAKAHIDKHYASTMLEYKSGFRDFSSGARWAIDRMNGEDK